MSVVDHRLSINCEEEKAIEELQMRMNSSLTPGLREDEKLLYYRFLKARDFDVDKAERMLRKHLIWRRIYQIETILEDFKPKEVFLKHTYPSVVGFDKDGDIVRYSPAGTFSPIEVINCSTPTNFMKHWFWFAEKTVQMISDGNKKTGKKGYQCTMIFDLDKIALLTLTSKVAINMFLSFIQAYQDNYPERMKNAYVINAPPYFVLFFSIVKTIMSIAMLRKIHIYGTTGWEEELLEKIDADVLPAFLGGNRTDPDGNPRCRTFINQGGTIPSHYQLTAQDRYFKNPSQVRKIKIPPSRKEGIQVQVDELGSLLCWEFLVKGKDIGLGVFLEESNCKLKELIPVQKYSTPNGIDTDVLKCRLTGKYVFIFDNSYSWRNSKEVQYCITVVKPTL